MKMKIKKGFSLLELTLVLGVGTMVAFMKFQDMKNEQESILASAVGQQMKQIGEAVNGYINIRYDKLSTLSNAAGTGTDPGPRTCSGSVCEISYQTLINEGLLPSTYTGTNANKSSYKIILKRDGTSPNFVINGLITTSTAWIEGGKTRYDLLGNAMQTAGIDSGMTKTTSIASGHSGQWSETSANFNNITSTGQLAFRVGFNSALYSVYLRRDGTLPMTGDLNLDGHNINNVAALNATGNITTTGDLQARNIKATGKVDADGNISAGNWVWAKNGYGDAIGFGGDAYGGDYEIRLGTAKQLTLYSPSAGNYTTVLQVNRNAKIDQRLGLMGYDPNDLPSGWGGGLRTLDVYAAGTVATGSGGNLTSYMNATGVHTQSNITASGNITAGGDITGNGVYGNYIHSNGNIDANGRINAGEFVYINGQANVGWGCSPNGVVGRTPEGKVISCVNGVWRGSTGSPVIRTAYASAYRFPGAVAYCAGSEKVVGGGGQCNTAEGYVWLTVSRPNGDNSWYAGCDTTKNITATITVYAICQ
ncbi:shufflon system plasmid conjugative transfer pilus tip adhesin PilV [Citrobacter sp. Cf093]|uniref:shufflon system plasmid conjugative transfer pilus tip adhesin PilV n=1 Tax=unclassified Citrobacter TaxID=2644389 RepID=UPI002577F709|nr:MULTISPECIES: shufflon system plasmid conjugative transfer pilus tip adhesin PilV [unclassified Citrobacter]MDM3157137.1 shufflon system plasmid conjugative transfer pilus tip adhesin PilV [Citrobacter sp. Cf122]MDM3214297.1 shufflon system plasmid conjugative transfer pilus tip adhesin PilV [Citrobacter sp. Cf093]